MILRLLVGETLSIPVVPPAVAIIGITSNMLANIPVVAAMLLLAP